MGRRLIIAGWDGATWGVLAPLLAAGRLPTLARLVKSGSRATLYSTWPPVSAAAWVTILTGVGPGEHGVFDFRNLAATGYDRRVERLVGSDGYTTPTLLEYAGAAGRRIIADHIPMTYPPWPINGVMVAGYPTPDGRRPYTSPPELAEQLGPLATHSADEMTAAEPAVQAALLRRAMAKQSERLLSLTRERWDLLFFVNGAVDGAQHRFFKYVTPGYPGVTATDRARYGELLAEMMVAADFELGRLLEAVDEGSDVLLISDHGGGVRPLQAFHLNAWLAGQGWLAPRRGTAVAARRTRQWVVEWLKQRTAVGEWAKRHLPDPVKQRLNVWRSGADQIDWAATIAFRVKLNHPIEGIRLNVQGREKLGVVAAADYERVRDELMAALRTLTELVAVRPREAVYQGRFVERAPDILVQLRADMDGGAGVHAERTAVSHGWLDKISGYHTVDGILVAAGPSFRRGATIADATLVDVAPTILHMLGAPVPKTMTGRVLTSLLAASRPIERGDPLPERVVTDGVSDQAGLRRALRNLGYLD